MGEGAKGPGQSILDRCRSKGHEFQQSTKSKSNRYQCLECMRQKNREVNRKHREKIQELKRKIQIQGTE